MRRQTAPCLRFQPPPITRALIEDACAASLTARTTSFLRGIHPPAVFLTHINTTAGYTHQPDGMLVMRERAAHNSVARPSLHALALSSDLPVCVWVSCPFSLRADASLTAPGPCEHVWAF